MAGTGWLAREGFAGRCTWAFDGETVSLTPEGRPPEAYPIRELQGVGGEDEHALELTVGGAVLILSRLGGDGPTLRERLARAWLPARTRALRLTGAGEGVPFAGAVARGGAVRPFQALVFDDVVAFAEAGGDVQPLFLALVAEVAHDRAAYRVTLTGWDGVPVTFARMGGRTDEFAAALTARRETLAGEAAAALAARLPALPLAARAAIGAAWPPGRVLALAELERIAPGFTAAVRSSWLASLPRSSQAEALLAWAAGGTAFLGYSRAAAAEEDAAEPPAPAAEEEVDAPSVPDDPTAPLWLLAGRADGWRLECFSLADHATYRFSPGDDVPGLVAQLLCAPQFSRTALYRPLERLVGERAEFAAAARDLPFLRALRGRFAGRIIHTTLAAWQRALG